MSAAIRYAALVLTTLLTAVAAQAQTDQVGLAARIHFNTQTADFDRARAFYRLLGYTRGRSDFPRTNTYAMARSLGMYNLCTYEIEDIEVMFIPEASGPTAIDLIQFKVPFNDEPPYAQINHLGMAYAALGTHHFDADYRYLRNNGVDFISPPAEGADGRFVFMRDPDGVFLKLVEVPGESPAHTPLNIVSMPYIGINVSNLGEALAFYTMLGYTEVQTFSEAGSAAQGKAYGLDGPFRLRGADVSLPAGDRHTLRLIQWLEPFLDEPPYPAPISHIGIHRIALAVADLDRAVDYLRAQGVSFLSDIAPCCSGTGQDTRGIINALDPDGTFVELVGPIQRRALLTPPDDCE